MTAEMTAEIRSVPLLPPLHDAVLCAPFPFLYGVLSAQSVDLSTGVV